MAGQPFSSLFCFYRDSPERRTALARPPGATERYLVFGLDDFADRGVRVRHNLERGVDSCVAVAHVLESVVLKHS